MDGLVVPKAALTAAFLRSDSKTTPVSKDDLSQFLTSLDQAVARCSREDVQRCKDWLLKYAVSEGRLEAILKFLTALSKSSADDPRVSSRSAPVSSRKKRLHILYILNDLLHHTKYHESNSEIQTILTNRLESHLLSLVELSASYKLETNRKLHGKLSQLMTLWKDNGYYDKQFIDKLRERMELAGSLGAASAKYNPDIIVAHGKVPEDTNRDTPWFLPKTHGDYSTPWYDLPAGNLIPHIIPRSSRPIDPRDVRPLQLKAGPADEELVDAVKKLLQDAEYIYGECDASERGIVDIDNIGQPLVKDEGVGDMVVSDTYYGWSTRFCEQMKRLRRGGPPKDRGRSISRERDRSYSRSLSRSRSRMSSPRKRRRYDSRSLSRSRSRSLRGYASRSRSRSYSSRGSRSRSPRKYRSRSRSPRRYRSRSRSKTPPRYRRSSPSPYKHHSNGHSDSPFRPSSGPLPPQSESIPRRSSQQADFPAHPPSIPPPPPSVPPPPSSMPPQPPSWPSYGNFPSISNQHHAPNSMVNPPNSQFPGSFNPQFPAAGAGMPFPPPPPPPVGHPGFMPPHTQDMNQQAINFQQFAELFRQGMPWPQSQYPNSNMGQSNPNMSPGQWQQPPQQGGPHGGYGGGGNANFGGNNRGGWQQNQGYGRGGRGGRGRGRGW